MIGKQTREYHYERLHACSVFCLLLALIAGFVFPLVEAAGQDDGKADRLAQRFLKEAPRAWEDYRAFTDRLDGTVTYQQTKDGKGVAAAQLEFKHNNSCRLASAQGLPNGRDQEGDLLAYNTLYAFRLSRGFPGRPWTITDTEPLSDGSVPSNVQYEMSVRLTMLQKAVSLWGKRLTDLLQHPSFRVLEAMPVTQDGADFVKIVFDNTHPFDVQEKPFIPIQSGSIVLDPENWWCLQSWDVHEITGHSTLKSVETRSLGSMEYQGSTGKYRILKHSVRTDYSLTKGIGWNVAETRTDYDLRETPQLPPDAEFTLTAFGLPEPYGVEPKSSRWWIWAAVAGFACLITGFFVRRHYRQQA